MSKIAFLGLGMMGTPMAERLIEAGNDVTVWNRNKERAVALARLAPGVADSPADAVVGAEFVVTMLATPQAVEEVLFGAGGVVSAIEPDQVWVDMSTVGPEQFRHAASRMPSGVGSVDAPVRGSVLEATEGRLQIFVGADDGMFDRMVSLLAPLGDVRHVGPAGAGAATKLVINLTLVAAMVALGEALALAQGMGLDQGAVLDILSDSPIGGIVRAKRANVEAAQYPPSFKLDLAAKDIGLVDHTAVALGLHLPLAAAARRWMDAALSEGAGGLDFSAVAATVLEQARGTTEL